MKWSNHLCCYCGCHTPLFPLQSRVGAELLLDPTHDEAFRENGNCLLSLMPTQNKVFLEILSPYSEVATRLS